MIRHLMLLRFMVYLLMEIYQPLAKKWVCIIYAGPYSE